MLTLVLLPGMDGTGLLFKPFVDVLDGKFAVQVVHYPQTGEMGYTELEAVAQAALPTQGRFIILGESFSGPIAISLAASRPDGLIGLVLCCTFARNPFPCTQRLRPLASLLPMRLVPHFVQSMLMLGRFATPMLRALLAESLAQVSADTIRQRLQAITAVDVSTKLGTINVPVLYLQATEDRLVPAAAAKIIIKALPDTEIVRLQAPHSLLQAVPVDAKRAIERFIHGRCILKRE